MKQLKVIRYLANGYSVSHAMLMAGYSEAYAHNPQKLMRTKKMRVLLDRIGPSADDIANYIKARLDDNGCVGVSEYNYLKEMNTLRLIDIVCRIKGDYYSPLDYKLKKWGFYK